MCIRCDAAGEADVALQIRWDRTGKFHSLEKFNLRNQRDDEFRLAVGNVHLRASRVRIQHEFGLHVFGDSEMLKNLVDMRRARTTRIEADGFRAEQGSFWRFRSVDIGLGRSGANADAHSGARDVGARAPCNLSLLNQIINDVRSENRGIEWLAGLDLLSYRFRGIILRRY